jgi:hypothetical protein
MARKPSAVARELLRNFPKGGKKRRRRQKGGNGDAEAEAAVEETGVDDASLDDAVGEGPGEGLEGESGSAAVDDDSPAYSSDADEPEAYSSDVHD